MRISSSGYWRIQLLICSHLERKKEKISWGHELASVCSGRETLLFKIFRKSGHTEGHASERASLFSDQSESRFQTIVNNSKTMAGACGQNSTRRLVDPRWSHMPIVNYNVAGFSCLQMGHFARYLKWLLFAVMTDSSNFVLKRIGTYDLTGNRLGKGNFAYVELATNRITKSKVRPRIAFWFQSQRQMIVQ